MNKEILKILGYQFMVDRVEAGLCPFCKQPTKREDITDPLAVREFNISGLCLHCQGEVFGDSREGI